MPKERHYPDVEPNPDFAALEENILKYWKESRAFEQSVARRPAADNSYVFYDGPPFANGLPHYGHLLTGYVKDVIARYQTMRGRRVERRFGWDCHGLPAEMAAEKELGISGRAAIQKYGIDKFNEHCRTSVMKYVEDWRYYVTRQGRWVDFDNDYKTMDEHFMESVLWAFKQLYDKGLVYESMRVMPYSWAAETPVSNFETRIDNATRPREDKAVYVKFKLKGKPKGAPEAKNYYLIAWTTTPWTLPSNLALAVNAELPYTAWKDNADCYITALGVPQSGKLKGANIALPEVINASDDDGTNEKSEHWFPGRHLVDLSYEPLFSYLKGTPNAFKVLDGGKAVVEGEGTGVLHVAPGFGEVDQEIANRNGIETITPVDEKGRFTDEIFDIPWDTLTPTLSLSEGEGGTRVSGRVRVLSLKGLTVVADTRIAESDIVVSDEDKARHISAKDVAKFGLANMRIVRWLKDNDKLVHQENYTHNYPHCWRTDTPLIYRAMSSWYVQVTAIKDKMAKNNQAIHWIPDHVREGQMGKGIESAPDWSISRNRFWGTPIPIWKSPSGKLIVPGSIAEIEKLSGQKVKDLHRPHIDDIIIKQGGEDYTRVEDVFDCWFESGSMPYAQLHYPFENKDKFEANFPADFITEYIAQTRGWFYTLQVLSTALFECAPFKHVICHGVVIDEETGLKYSKRLKNYKDPKEVMDEYGSDALRWLMLSSPVMRGADLAVDPEGKFIRDVVRLTIKPIWNAYNFFTLYANADGIKAKLVESSPHPNPLPEGEGTKNTSSTGRGRQAEGESDEGLNILDRYILAKCKAAVEQARTSLDAYDTPGATDAITQFFEVFNNWYIRRSRPRFWAEKVDADKQAAYDTLYTVLTLMVKAAAPLLPFVSEAVWCGLTGEKESVHWQDFPDVSALYTASERVKIPMASGVYETTAEKLILGMDRAKDICSVALSIRNNQNIRARQPLKRLTLVQESGMSILLQGVFDSIIAEEVNVKATTMSERDVKDFATYVLKINSAALGKRLPDKMKQILPASKRGEWKILTDGTVEILGEKLKEDEYSIHLQPKPEYKDSAAPLPSNDALIILDLTITPELEAEGRARDLVRMVQQARKDSGLDVSDRIALALDVPPAFQSAITAHGDYIKEQTLAVSIAQGKGKSEKQITQELDGETFTIGISKAA